MRTEYWGGDARDGMSRNIIDRLVGEFMFYKLGIAPIPKRKTTQEYTPNVTAEEALHVADMRTYDAKLAAFRLMNARKQEQVELHRQKLLAQGAGECVICGTFVVPAAEKPWTKEKCCSKSCFAKFKAEVSAGMPAAAQVPHDVAAAGPKAARVVAVACGCGNSFVVPALFLGAQRACPRCGQKVLVAE
ncbi:MAG: hypothetical protein JNK76_14365 [Planctomycetales bacterium]|nr:hypothetical protein [Planctomycetales bacterium]MBN8624824.1 hypothetical protein [Planctomycetota bacterium]